MFHEEPLQNNVKMIACPAEKKKKKWERRGDAQKKKFKQ